MSEIDLLIFGICKKKHKIRDIKKILSDKDNFEYDKVQLAYKIKSLSSSKVWLVSLNPPLCNCTFNSRFKVDKKGPECIHLLALRVYKKLNIL